MPLFIQVVTLYGKDRQSSFKCIWRLVYKEIVIPTE